VLELSELRLETPDGDRTAMVITPTKHLVWGLDRVSRPAPPEPSDLDRTIVAEARALSGTELTIMRGRDDAGNGSFRIEAGVSEPQARDIARSVLRDSMPLYRELIRVGLRLHLHCEWEPIAAAAFRDAGGELAARLAGKRDPASQLDSWILGNLLFFFSLSFRRTVSGMLPNKLGRMDKRSARIREMALAIPSVFD